MAADNDVLSNDLRHLQNTVAELKAEVNRLQDQQIKQAVYGDRLDRLGWIVWGLIALAATHITANVFSAI